MKINYKDVLVIFLIVLIISFAYLPLFKNIQNINMDWDFLQNLSFVKCHMQMLKDYHQFPFRTPYFCGGYSFVNSPTTGGFPNLFFLITPFIYGEVISIKIYIFLALLIGALGMYYLTKFVLKYNHLGALFSTITFFLSGCLYKILMLRGNPFIMEYFFMPLLLGLFIKTKEKKKYVFLVAIILFFIIQGGLKFVVILLFLFLYACFEGKWVYMKNFLLVLLFTFLLGAVRIIPVSQALQESKYSINFYNLFGNDLLIRSALMERIYGIFKLLLMHRNYPLDISIKGYFPLQFYIGYIPVILFMVSSFLYWREQLKWSMLLIIFSLLTFGTNTPLDLFRLLHNLPFFNAIYKPAKYFIPIVIFIITLGAGRFFLILERFRKGKRLAFALLLLLFIISVTDLYLTNRPQRDIYPTPVPKYERQKEFFQVKNLSPNSNITASKMIPLQHSWELTFPTQYELLLQGIGKINAYTNIHLGEYATPKYYIEWNGVESFDSKNYIWHYNPAYRGEIYFLNNPNNKAEFEYFSPNKLIAKVTVVKPDTLIINQNYDTYWRSDITKPISQNGLLAVKLNKTGEYLVKFNYVPVRLFVGRAINLASLLVIIYLWKHWAY